MIRSPDPERLPLPFLAAAGVVMLLVVVQAPRVNPLVWVKGLQPVPVVLAIRNGVV